MSQIGKTTQALTAVAVATVVCATMVAMWSFAHVRPAWGAYNLAIASVASVVFIMVRTRGRGV